MLLRGLNSNRGTNHWPAIRCNRQDELRNKSDSWLTTAGSTSRLIWLARGRFIGGKYGATELWTWYIPHLAWPGKRETTHPPRLLVSIFSRAWDASPQVPVATAFGKSGRSDIALQQLVVQVA